MLFPAEDVFAPPPKAAAAVMALSDRRRAGFGAATTRSVAGAGASASLRAFNFASFSRFLSSALFFGTPGS